MRSLAVLVLMAACGRIGFDPHGDGGGSDGVAIRNHNRAFVTAQTFSPPWGGIAEADVRCQQAADVAELDGTFLALLGDEAVRPLERPPIANARGWVDLRGAVLVDQPAEWFNGRMRRPLHINERGESVGYSQIWLGARAGATCNGWTAQAAPAPSTVTTTNYFTEFTVTDCAMPKHYACIEYMKNTPVDDPPQTGRIAFVTTTNWAPGVGITAADGLCGSQATLHGLPGTYKALLTTSTESAVSRLALTGAPWIRVDGLRWVDDPMDLANRPVLAAFLLRGDGTPAADSAGGWSWSGTAGANCANWTSSAATQMAMTGDSSSADRALFLGRQTYACDVPRPYVCLEQ